MNSKNRSSSTSRRRKRSSRRDKGDGGFAQSEKRKSALWVFLGVSAAIIMLAAIYEYDRDKGPSIQDVQDLNMDGPTIAEIIESNDFDLLKSTCARLFTNKRDSYPVQMDNLEKRVLLTQRARDVAKNEVQMKWADLNYLRTAIALETVAFNNKTEPTVHFAAVKAAAIEMQDNPDQAIAHESTLSLLIAKMIDLLRNDDWESETTELVTYLQKTLEKHPEDEYIAESIPKVLLMLQTDPAYRTLDVKLHQTCADHYSKSKMPTFRKLGRNFHTQAIVLKYLLGQKHAAFIVDAKSAAVELSQAIDEIIANEDLDPQSLFRLNGSCKIMEIHQQYRLALENAKKLQVVAAKFPEVDVTNFMEVSQNLVTRCRVIGKPIRLDEIAVDGTRIRDVDLQELPILICYLPGRDSKLQEVFEIAKEIKENLLGQVELVMLAVEGDRKHLAETAKFCGLESEVIIDTDFSTQIYKQFPTRQVPSFLLMDPDRNAVEWIVDSRELLSRIQALNNSINR